MRKHRAETWSPGALALAVVAAWTAVAAPAAGQAAEAAPAGGGQPTPVAAPEFKQVRQPAPAPVEGTEDEPQPTDDSAQGWPRHEFASRLMTGIEYSKASPKGAQSGSDESSTEFFLQQARVKARVFFDPDLRANISFDLSDGLRPERTSRVAYLRNAYINVHAHDYLEIRAGQFKRPYSKLELTSSGTLPFRGRGLFNGEVVSDEHWGTRALGVMLAGRHRPAGLRWYVGASEPAWASPGNRSPGGVTTLARLVYDPVKWLSIGAGGGHKFLTYNEVGASLAPDPMHLLAAGADITVKTKRLRVGIEALAAQRRICDVGKSLTDCTFDLDTRKGLAAGATVYGAYALKLGGPWRLQPVLFAEYADSDTGFTRTEAVRGMGGVNLLWGEHLRLMAQLEVVEALGKVRSTPSMMETLPVNLWKTSKTAYLMLSAQM